MELVGSEHSTNIENDDPNQDNKLFKREFSAWGGWMRLKCRPAPGEVVFLFQIYSAPVRPVSLQVLPQHLVTVVIKLSTFGHHFNMETGKWQNFTFEWAKNVSGATRSTTRSTSFSVSLIPRSSNRNVEKARNARCEMKLKIRIQNVVQNSAENPDHKNKNRFANFARQI